jgi:hypothetical protein
MKYTIVGAHRDTGDDVEMVIEARTPALAQEAANRNGIMVARVAPAFTQAPQQLQQGHVPHAPLINVALPRRGSSLGVASMVLGIIAFLICWIPFVNLLGVPLSAVGLLLGLIGIVIAFTRQGSGIGMPIAGTLLCGLSLGVVIVFAGAVVSGVAGVGEAINKESARQSATNQVVVNPPAQAAEVEWAPASSPVLQGDIQVQVVSVRVGKVPMQDYSGDLTWESKDARLIVGIAIDNKSAVRKVDYRSWGADSVFLHRDVSLSDNFSNRYTAFHHDLANHPVGAVGIEALYPGGSVKDVLVFEKPIDNAEHLDLALPAGSFGGTGMLRIRIPASMIQR